MLVKNDPDDFAFSVDHIAEIETAIFRKELFETSVDCKCFS